MIIYKITNIINGKIYIGKTVKDISCRWNKHLQYAKRKVNRYLYDAMNHYGYDNFTIEEIDRASTIDELNEKEKYWISLLDTTNKNNGYNMQKGGTGGAQPPEIMKLIGEKVSKKNKGKHRTEETKRKISFSHIGFRHSEESKEKMRLFHIGKPPHPNAFTEEAKRKGQNNNTHYKRINREELFSMIIWCDTVVEVAKYFNTTRTTIYNKSLIYFNIPPSEIRRIYNESVLD